MRQIVALAIVALLAVAAWTAPSPPRADIGTTTIATTVPEPASAAKFSSCPWAVATDADETYFGLQAMSQADVRMSFPFSGEIRTTVEETIPGPAATSIRLSQHLAQGAAPAVIEFSDEPAAAASVVEGQGRLAASGCPSSTPKLWHVAGASTRPGEQADLVLFNPFPEDAVVDVQAHSEFGPEPNAELEGISIQSRSWKTVDLDVAFPARSQLALIVEAVEGNVIPSLAQTAASGRQALWPGVGLGEVWEFPVVRHRNLEPVMFIANDGTTDISYEIDLIDDEGTEPAAVAGTTAPLTQSRVPLAELFDPPADFGADEASDSDDQEQTEPVADLPPFGVRVRANGPIAAVVVAEGEAGLAVTAGSTTTSTQWLFPGVGAKPDAGYRLWLLNSGPVPLTVTLGPLDSGGFTGPLEKVSIAPGAIRSVPVDTFRVFGYVAEAPTPFAASWSVVGSGDIAFVTGTPVTRTP